MFEKFFSQKAFYFSNEYDLTNPFSISASRGFKVGKHDDRFFYNETFTTKLKDNKLENWI